MEKENRTISGDRNTVMLILEIMTEMLVGEAAEWEDLVHAAEDPKRADRVVE